MKFSRPKSFSKFENNTFNDFQYSFSKTSTGFYKPNTYRNNNFSKNFRLLSSNAYIPKFKEKLFSISDINDKITDSRGTSLPIQYKRLTEEENKRQFGFLYREEQNYNLALIKNFLNNMNMSKYKIKKEKKEIVENKDIKEKKEEKENKKENKIQKKIEIKIEQNNKEKVNKEIKTSEERNSKIKKNKTEESKPKIKIKNRNDIWLPKGYPDYELLVENPQLLKQKLKTNFFANNLPEVNLSDLSRKSKESDIFFKKPITFKESLYNKRIKNNNYNSSDIFHLKYNIENLAKCSEKYLFKEKNKDNYYITRESESKWSPKIPFLGFMNSPSIGYNIFNPSKKNSIGFTRDKVLLSSFKLEIISFSSFSSKEFFNI